MKTIVLRLLIAALPLCLIEHASADAPPGRYTVANGTVFDAKTKLTWQQAASTSTYLWAEAKAYCSGMWRLPTVKELLTIVDDSRLGINPTIDPVAFPGTPGGAYWSSTPATGGGTGGWEVQFGGSGIAYAANDSRDYVRCVLR